MSGNGRGVSGISLRDFFAAVLKGLGAPVTDNNLAKLGAIARVEGHGGDYNPFNYVVPANGSNDYNSVGVQNYPDPATGVAMSMKMLHGSRDTQKRMLASLLANDTYATFIHATADYYHGWEDPRQPHPWGSELITATKSERALDKINEQIDGPRATGWTGGAAPVSDRPGGTAGPTAGPPPGAPGYDAGRWAQAQEGAFTAWLRTQDVGAQQAIIDQLRQNTDLAGIGRILNDPNTAPPVKEYINFLAQIAKPEQQASLGRLAVQQQQPGAAPGTPPPSPELASLLARLGVSYPNAPQPTPALMAFLGGLGLSLQTAEQLQAKAVERIGATMGDQMADLTRISGRAKENLTGSLASRGTLASGEANSKYAKQAEDTAAGKSDIERAAADARGAADDALRQTKDLARQQAIDRLVGAETDQAATAAAQKAQEEAYRKEQQQADLNYARQLAEQQDAIKRQTDAYARQGTSV